MIATSSSLIPKKLTSSLPFQFNFANQFLQEPSQWTFQRHWNTGLVSSGASLTSWGGASLALVDDPSSDGVTIKMPYGVDVLHRSASHPSFPTGLFKTESGFIVRSVETGLGRWTLVVAAISVDAYPFFGFLKPDLSPWGYRNRCFLVALPHKKINRRLTNINRCLTDISQF